MAFNVKICACKKKKKSSNVHILQCLYVTAEQAFSLLEGAGSEQQKCCPTTGEYASSEDSKQPGKKNVQMRTPREVNSYFFFKVDWLN